MLVYRAALLLVVLASAPGAMADTTEIVGPMTIVMPSGWTRRAADPVMFYVAEASASGQDEGQVHVNAMQQPGATQAAVHATSITFSCLNMFRPSALWPMANVPSRLRGGGDVGGGTQKAC